MEIWNAFWNFFPDWAYVVFLFGPMGAALAAFVLALIPLCFGKSKLAKRIVSFGLTDRCTCTRYATGDLCEISWGVPGLVGVVGAFISTLVWGEADLFTGYPTYIGFAMMGRAISQVRLFM